MPDPAALHWTLAAALEVDLFADDRGRFAVEGQEGMLSADARLVPGAGSGARDGCRLRMRPLLEPAGAFDVSGVIAIQLYRRNQAAPLEDFVDFESRFGPRFYDCMSPAGWRYGGICGVLADGLDLEDDVAEPYSIVAWSGGWAARGPDARAHYVPPDMSAITERCRRFKTPGTVRWLWLEPRQMG